MTLAALPNEDLKAPTRMVMFWTPSRLLVIAWPHSTLHYVLSPPSPPATLCLEVDQGPQAQWAIPGVTTLCTQLVEDRGLLSCSPSHLGGFPCSFQYPQLDTGPQILSLQAALQMAPARQVPGRLREPLPFRLASFHLPSYGTVSMLLAERIPCPVTKLPPNS